MRYLILGGSGLLGSSLVPFLVKSGHEVKVYSRSPGFDYCFELDNEELLTAMLCDFKPTVVVNLVALTNVDLCEQRVDLAFHAHVKTIEALVKVSNKLSFAFYLIHISTDQVYSGTGPHYEDRVSPLNTYALTKYIGEITLSNFCNPVSILRTNFFGKSLCPNRSSFTDWIYSKLVDNIQINGFSDLFFSPLHVKTLCEYIAIIADLQLVGTYNIGSSDFLSKGHFIKYFADSILHNNSLVVFTSASNFDFDARRPLDMTMNTQRIVQHVGKLPCIKSQIEIAAQEYL